MLYRIHLAWAGFELTTLVVTGTGCIGSYKSNYHTNTTTTTPLTHVTLPYLLDIWRYMCLHVIIYKLLCHLFKLPGLVNISSLYIISKINHYFWYTTKMSTILFKLIFSENIFLYLSWWICQPFFFFSFFFSFFFYKYKMYINILLHAQ